MVKKKKRDKIQTQLSKQTNHIALRKIRNYALNSINGYRIFD